MLKNCDAIIFDLDGTLWDPTKTCRDSWNEVITRGGYGVPLLTDKDLHQVFGLKFDKIAALLFPTLPESKQKELLQACVDYENEYIINHGGELYEPLEPILKSLKEKYRLFIVSNCQAGYIEAFLKHYELEDYFEDFECPGNTKMEKNHNIGLIIQRNNLKAPVYIGDTDGDQQAAGANHIPFIFAQYGFGTVQNEGHALKKLSDLV